MNVNEQEVDEDPVEDDPMAGGTPDEEIEVADEEDVEIEEPADQPDIEKGPGAGSSFSGVQDQINQIRAGRSVRDSSVNPVLRSYYDTLDDNERVVLSTFLKALAAGLSGGVENPDELQDPSQPPVSIAMSKVGDDQEKEPKVEKPVEKEPEAETGDEELAMDMLGGEPAEEEEIDVEEEEAAAEPPIRIGESQDLSLVRKRLRKLMG